MKKIIITAILAPLFFLANAQSQINTVKKTEGYYLNPVFAGDYPDPSILRDGSDYYIVHSSFEYYPGLLIWHSKDLINWKPVTHALYKNVGPVWAPDLVKHNNRYYIYFPANNTNYVVSANSIAGPWTDPVELKIDNIDPGHFTDADGKRYLYFSNGDYVPLSEDGLSLAGPAKHVYNGWAIPREWSIECFCMEGPKITKRGDYYYLTTAEGGTAGPATSHMVISARSKSPLGPWENSPYNPIIRTKSGAEKWWSKGHGSLVEDPNGKWWMFFHGYEKDHYNMGRQTLLEPIEWTKDGWYKTPDGIKADQAIKMPAGTVSGEKFSLNDNFEGSKLKPQWRFYNEYDTSRFRLADNSLIINGKGNSIGNSSPLVCVPADHSYTAQVELWIEGEAIGGLVFFYNDKTSSGILADKENVLTNLRGWQFPTEKNVIKKHVFLRVENLNNTVNMYYSTDGKKWNKVETSLEVSSYHHNSFGGFMGLRLGLCSMGEGKIRFSNFVYQPIK
jgi:xylan 1,4-beta-xylosidase